MNQYYSLALGVLKRFLRVFVFASISALAVYWTAHLGDSMPIWLLSILGPVITGGLAAVDKWARGKLAGN